MFRKSPCVAAGPILQVAWGKLNLVSIGIHREKVFCLLNEDAQKAQVGDVLSLSLEFRTDGDSVLQIYPEIQTMLQAPKFQGDIFEGLQMMHEGDSATFIIPAKEYFTTYNYGQVPDFVTEKSMLFVTACIHSIQSFEEYRTIQMQEMQGKEKELITQYLQEHDITVEPTASGLYYTTTSCILSGKGWWPHAAKGCGVFWTPRAALRSPSPTKL